MPTNKFAASVCIKQEQNLRYQK